MGSLPAMCGRCFDTQEVSDLDYKEDDVRLVGKLAIYENTR